MEAKDIDLNKLPEGTMVKIVDKWRKADGIGSQNSAGYMDKYLGGMLEIKSQSPTRSVHYYVKDEGGWSWYVEFFEAIKLPNTDTWYKVIEKDGKYVATDYANDDVISNSIEAPTSCPEVKIYLPLEDVVPEIKELPAKYMVYVSGKASPKKVHNTYESACQEAERLAGKEVGYVVSVCKIEKQFIGKVIVEEIE